MQGIIYFEKKKSFSPWGFLIDLLSAENSSLVRYLSF